jgi:hypothetical protein
MFQETLIALTPAQLAEYKLNNGRKVWRVCYTCKESGGEKFKSCFNYSVSVNGTRGRDDSILIWQGQDKIPDDLKEDGVGGNGIFNYDMKP